MAVSLSPLAGAGWQFFNNNGIPLAGGLLYTYAAGTSTPLATYTTFSGNISNSNPIILDSAGRVPNEIWITVGYGYKFVLQDANTNQIATWDNIPINASSPFANDSSSIAYEQGNSVTAGAFIVGQSYLITSVGTTNFVAIGASSNATGIYFIATGAGSGTGTAKTSRSVQSKLQESVSVLDFGAKGDGTTDDTTAIQAALSSGNNIYFPQGTYVISSALIPVSNQTISGAGMNSTFIKQTNAAENGFSLDTLFWVTIQNMAVTCSASSPTNNGIYYTFGQNHVINSVIVTYFRDGFRFTSANTISITNGFSLNNTQNGFRLDSAGAPHSTLGINLLNCNSYYNQNGIFVTGLSTGCTFDNINLGQNTQYGIAFYPDATGNPSDFFCTKVISDSNGGGGFLISALVNQCYFNNCWSSNIGTGYNFYSAGTVIQIVGGFFFNCNGHGIYIHGDYNSVTGANIWNAGIDSANTYDSIYVDSNSVSITGCTMLSTNSGPTNKTRYAVNLASGATNAVVNGNNVVGVFGTPKINVTTTDQITLQNITNNAGFTNTAVIASEFGSTYGIQTVLNGATTTLTTLDSVGLNGNYLLFIGQANSGTGGINALAFIRRGISSSQIFTIHTVSGVALSLSGQAVQLTNTFGADIGVDWTLVKYVADGAINT